jgi:hypothetical protein
MVEEQLNDKFVLEEVQGDSDFRTNILRIDVTTKEVTPISRRRKPFRVVKENRKYLNPNENIDMR